MGFEICTDNPEIPRSLALATLGQPQTVMSAVFVGFAIFSSGKSDSAEGYFMFLRYSLA